VFYASFGVVVTSSVAIAGVLLGVFRFLIIPAAIGVMFASSLRATARDRLDRRNRDERRGLAGVLCIRTCRPAPPWCCAFGAFRSALAGLLYPSRSGPPNYAARRDRHRALV